MIDLFPTLETCEVIDSRDPLEYFNTNQITEAGLYYLGHLTREEAPSYQQVAVALCISNDIGDCLISPEHRTQFFAILEECQERWRGVFASNRGRVAKVITDNVVGK